MQETNPAQSRGRWRASIIAALSLAVIFAALAIGLSTGLFKPLEVLHQSPELLTFANAGCVVVLLGLICWLSWSVWGELRAMQNRQTELTRLSLVATKTDSAVVLTNPEGNIEWVNDGFTRISGRSLAEVAGRPPGTVLMGQLQNSRVVQKIRDGFSSRKHFNVEMLCSHKSSHRFWLSLNFNPVFNEREELANFIGVGYDITARKRAEDEWARVSRRNELLLNAAGDGIFGLDQAGQISFLNPAAARMTGWEQADLTGKPVSTILHQLRVNTLPGANDDHFTAVAFRDGKVAIGDTDHFRRKDGSTFPVEYTRTPIREGDRLVGTVVIFRDIADRKQSEALRTRQGRQYALRADIGFALTVSEPLKSLLQRCTQTLLKHLDGALAGVWTLNEEDDLLELQASSGVHSQMDVQHNHVPVGTMKIGQVAKEKMPNLTNDLLNDSHAGNQEWVRREKMAAFVGFPLMVEKRLIGVLGMYSRSRLPEDTLELMGAAADSIAQGILRKRAEEKVAEQAALLDKSQDAIVLIDLSNRCTYWNKSAERLYGWPAKETCGKRLDQLIYRDASYFDRAKKAALEKGEWKGELCQVTKGDEAVIVESQWTLVQDETGASKSILIINTDISEKKKMEAQILRTQRMDSLGTLAGGIAHDLNNVLAPILMSVEVLKDKLKDEQSRRMLSILESSAKRGADMVKQVLTFSRGVDGERILLQTRHLIKEVTKIIGETFPKTLQVRTSVAQNLWPILGDATQLHQVLLNLAVNARDAMADGGMLSISAENYVLEKPEEIGQPNARPGFYVVIKVSDTGSGIPREIMDKIFEPFFTTKAIGKGTGLGLSTVLGIVKSHGGFVQVQTEVGRGTTFLVYVPATENAQAQQGDGEAKKLPTGHGELILAVDDEASVLTMTKETLETYGYRVVTARDGAEAVAAYSQQRHEIKGVLTDMLMPLMDGPATIRALKKLDPEVKIIAASGLMDNEKVKDATGLDNIAFLMKPFTAERLISTVHKVLSE